MGFSRQSPLIFQCYTISKHQTIHYLLMQSNIAIYKHTEMFFKEANTTPIMAIMTRKLKLDVHMNIITAGGKQPTHEAMDHLMKYFIFKF